MPKLQTNRPTALGVHIFAGGFTTGVKQAGFNVLAHLEDGPYGVSTAKLNWPNLDVRISEENWRAEEFYGKVDFLYSNPPCAIFSSAGIATTRGPDAWREDPRLGCWHRAFEVFRIVKPKVFALESVCQAYTKGREVIDQFTKGALELGYLVTHVLMDAKWTGVPQSRKRFFFVAHLTDFCPSFDFCDPPTVGDVLSSVDDIGFVRETRWTTDSRCLRVLKKTAQGKKLRTTYDELNPDPKRDDRGRIPGRPGFLGSRLHSGRQMGAFIGDVFFHPNEHRSLGVNEMLALCGYPKKFKLSGSPTGAPGLIARAVLPPVGSWLARVARASFGTTVDKPTVYLRDLRKPGLRAVDMTSEYNVTHQDVTCPIILRGVGPKIAVTGFTRAQAFPRSSKDLARTVKKIDVPAAIVTEMERQGAIVDWSVCDLGGRRREFDGTMVMLGLCTSMHGLGFAAQAFWTLRQAMDAGKPCVLFYDDWKIKQTQSQLLTFYHNFDTSVRKRYTKYARCNSTWFLRMKPELTSVAEALCNDWPVEWSALCPMYSGWGDRSRAFSLIPTDRVLTVDSTPAVIDLERGLAPSSTASESWCLASLGDHREWVKSLGLGWPVAYSGHKKCGERLVSENSVRDRVEAHWGSLSPPYPQAGSGWFRARYVYSALAGRVIYPDPAEADVMGDSYKFDPLEFEAMNVPDRRRLANRQRRWLLGDEPRVNTHHEQFSAEVAKIIEALTSKPSATHRMVPARQGKIITKVVKKRVATKVMASSGTETSGRFIRRLWMTGKYATPAGVEELVRLVHKNWEKFPRSGSRECRTKAQDVRWNVSKLIESGEPNVPPFPGKLNN